MAEGWVDVGSFIGLFGACAVNWWKRTAEMEDCMMLNSQSMGRDFHVSGVSTASKGQYALPLALISDLGSSQGQSIFL